jgi:RNA polymerase sigma-70 factor (ECF subfamily)
VQDDLTLLSRARALDKEALGQIHDTYYGPIFRYISFRVSDYQTAEDLASEVFTRLLTALRDKSAPQKTLRGWLYSVAAIVVKDHYRKKYRSGQTELNENMPSHTDTPDQVVEMILNQERLHEAMSTLTDDQQNVIALRFGYGMAIRDVAQTLRKSEGSVKMLQARAINTLSQQLNPQGGAR